MSKEIIYNYLLDLKKKDVDQFDRAVLIKEYIESNSLSIRKLAEKLDVPKSTIEDWLLWSKITREKYLEFLRAGYSHTDIYRYLRENKTLSKKSFAAVNPLVNHLEKSASFILKNKKNFSPKEIDSLKKLINACNYALFNAEKNKSL